MLFTITDNNEYYVDLIKSLLQSLNDNSPEDEIRVYVVKCNDEFINRLSRINPSAKIIKAEIQLPEDPSESKSIIAHYRTTIIKECFLEEHVEKMGWLDSDILVRKPLFEFWEITQPNTLHVQHRPKNPVHGRFQVGVFSIGRSLPIKNMIIEWDKKTQEDNKYWFAEQKALYTSYIKFKDYIQFVDMDIKFNDHTFCDDSVIWHCKGHHFRESVFQKEFRYYLMKANEKFNG